MFLVSTHSFTVHTVVFHHDSEVCFGCQNDYIYLVILVVPLLLNAFLRCAREGTAVNLLYKFKLTESEKVFALLGSAGSSHDRVRPKILRFFDG